LESLIEGEDEILGQVRRAWLDASAAGALSPALDAAFRLAVQTGRRARRLGDRHAWTSLADSAVAHVAAALTGQPAACVLVAGTGPMGLRAAAGLRERFGRALRLEMAGRTPERVQAHAAPFHATPLLLDGIPVALARADAAIIALRTTHALFGTDAVRPRSPDRPLLLIDLSVPRAVDAAVAALPGVRVLDVDTLAGNEGCFSRWDARARTQVEALVERAVDHWTARAEQTDADATLTALRVRADGIRRRQLDLTLRRLPHLDAEARWMIESLTHAIVNKLLHEPTMRLKDDRDGRTAQQIRSLFGMDSA
jgi:glutamyl-tRNA reductase